jgi:hypothetical protein
VYTGHGVCGSGFPYGFAATRRRVGYFMMASRTVASRDPVARGLYVTAALVVIALVFAGFARTYYLKLAFGTPALPLLLHAHGLVMSAWFVLFLVQACLVARGNVRLHRQLGAAGSVLAAAVVIMGSTVAIHGARHGHAPPGAAPLAFLIIPLGDMVVFTILVGLALWFRKRRDVHRRLMLLATIAIVTAAVARIPPPDSPPPLAVVTGFSTTILCVLGCVAWDTLRHRRLHPAFGWGGALVIASWPLRLALSGSTAWLAVAGWLTR